MEENKKDNKESKDKNISSKFAMMDALGIPSNDWYKAVNPNAPADAPKPPSSGTTGGLRQPVVVSSPVGRITPEQIAQMSNPPQGGYGAMQQAPAMTNAMNDLKLSYIGMTPEEKQKVDSYLSYIQAMKGV